MDRITQLANALRCLPGVGPKSAQRMVYHLLKHQRDKGLHLSDCLKQAMEHVVQCKQCNTFCDHEICSLCNDKTRDPHLLCIVDSPADLSAIEQTHTYKGRYFVLTGKISPIDGMGPDEIGLPKLQAVIDEHPVDEIIMAFSPSIEGLTTMHFIRERFKNHPLKITQLAHGVPTGAELEYLDGRTIASALMHRASLTTP